MIRILIVDPRPAVRLGLEMRLALESDLQIVGGAGDIDSAVGVINTACPDVVIIDHDLPETDGIAAVGELVCCQNAPRVIMHSLRDDHRTREQGATAGARAFVGKQEGVDVLLETIRRVASGDAAAGIQSRAAILAAPAGTGPA